MDPSNPDYVNYVTGNYSLCFDCHDSYPDVSKEVIFSYQQGGNYDHDIFYPTPFYSAEILSLFREHCYYDNSTTYTDCNYDGLIAFDGITFVPLHNYKLLSAATFSIVYNMWNYRGDTSQKGKVSCPACHNVHGTDNTIRSTHDDYGIIAVQTGSDEYKRMTPFIENEWGWNPDEWPNSAYHSNNMMSYPIYCNISCHSLGRTNYWHTPSGE